jgi:PAS domain S-box-containing protein
MLLFEGEDGQQVVANRAAARMCGREFERTGGPGQCLGLLRRTDGAVLTYEELAPVRALRGETLASEEVLVRRHDGRDVPVLLSAGPIRDPHGQIVGAIMMADDVTTMKEAERTRQEWMSLVAHDLRQPITVITAYASMLVKVLDGGDPAKAAAARHILASARQVGRMIADLLDVSQIEARHLRLSRQPTDLTLLVHTAAERMAEVLDGHPLRLHLVDGLPLVEVDPGRLEQVLGNLLSNAAKYGFPGTAIDVTLTREERSVRLSVTNEGQGIAPEDLPALFQRFQLTPAARRERIAGLGLGLYITRGLVEAHGGHIWAESTPHRTTTFHLTLPLRAG